MSGHTKGPWRRDPENRSRVLAKDFTGTWRVLARIYGWNPDECKANADLFLAAPETAAERDRLRALVEELVGALEAKMNVRYQSDRIRADELGRAALAKAKELL